MSKQTDKEYKDKNTTDVTPTTTDTTPWFWVEQNNQKTSLSWFRFLWAFDERPPRPKHWDMIYNTKTRKLEIYVSQIYRWWIVPTVSDPYFANPWDYADYLGELWYTESGTNTPFVPSLPLWERANSVGFWAEQQSYFLVNNETSDRIITSWTRQKVGAIAKDFVETTLPDTRWVQTCIIPYTGYYLLMWHSTRLSKPWLCNTELRLMVNTKQVAYDSLVIPTITATTTGTDSLWWSISATTNITVWSLDYASQKVIRYGKLLEWDIVSAEVRQNSGWDLFVTQWSSFPTQTQYQTGFSIIWQ